MIQAERPRSDGRLAGVALVDQLPAANLVIVELGVNDYWSSVSPQAVAGYLATIVAKLRAQGERGASATSVAGGRR